MDEESVFWASIDRVDEGVAVLIPREGSARFTLPCSLLPAGAREGDILEVSIRRDAEATEEARRRAAERIERLKRRGEGRMMEAGSDRRPPGRGSASMERFLPGEDGFKKTGF